MSLRCLLSVIPVKAGIQIRIKSVKILYMEKPPEKETLSFDLGNLEKTKLKNAPTFIKEKVENGKEFKKLLKIYKFSYSNGDNAWILIFQERHKDEKSTEKTIRIYEERDGEEIGMIEAKFFTRLDVDNHTHQKLLVIQPFVGNTFTNDGLRRQGLGTRRLTLLNELCKKFFKERLRSSTIRTDESTGVWENLVQKGLAEIFMCEEDTVRNLTIYRYIFKK